jgi:uroporphyrinogen-III synthase
MSSNGETQYKRVETILVSQPKPERSPYTDLEQTYGIKVDFRPFTHVEPIDEKEFRKFKIRLEEYMSVIFTSRTAVDHYFRLSEEMRHKISPDIKYFCFTEQIANYLQKFIIYRKRKVFVGVKNIEDLKQPLMKHREKERYLLPCSDLGTQHEAGGRDAVAFLKDNAFNFQEAMMYRTVSSDLSDLRDIFYDVLVFFNPLGIKSLYDNFPDFKQKETRIAVFGNGTGKAGTEKGLTINIQAPTPEVPSMQTALERYLQMSNK